MLHSFHYYACYYALLWFLHQQQKAAAMTIIIDGATTQEWATQDEYHKLLEQSQRTGELTEASQRQQQLLYPDHYLQPPPLVQGGNVDLSSLGRIISKLQEAPTISGKHHQRQYLEDQPPEAASSSSSSLATDSQRQQQQQQQLQSSQEPQSEQQQQTASASAEVADENDELAAKSSAADELGLVFDLMEERQRHLQRLKQIQQHNSAIQPQAEQQQQQQQPPAAVSRLPVSSARTINDLVAVGDEHLESDLRLKERNAPRKYCGDILVNMLDVVCQGRFYDGGPQVVEPVIKSRRSAHDQAHLSGSSAFDPHHQHHHKQPPATTGSSSSSSSSRRRKPVGLDGQENNNISDAPGASSLNPLSSTQISSSPSQQQQQPTNLSKSININTNHNNNNVRNKHSKMSRYRAIRGASADCCDQPCDIDVIKAYCKGPS